MLPAQLEIHAHPRMGHPRMILGLYTGGLIVVGIAAMVLDTMRSPTAGTLGSLFGLGIFIFSWVANAMSVR